MKKRARGTNCTAERGEEVTDGTAVSRFQPFDREGMVCKTRRNLPHWTQNGCTYFVTFRLSDALPQSKLSQWREEREIWLKWHPKPWTPDIHKEYEECFLGRIQDWMDAGFGSCRLAEAAVREVVVGVLRHFDGKRYDLIEFVVMPNHVHLLVTRMMGGNCRKSFTHGNRSAAIGS